MLSQAPTSGVCLQLVVIHVVSVSKNGSSNLGGLLDLLGNLFCNARSGSLGLSRRLSRGRARLGSSGLGLGDNGLGLGDSLDTHHLGLED
jgi:hypothetical protein